MATKLLCWSCIYLSLATLSDFAEGDRTPVFEHGMMWDMDHIKRLPLRTPLVVSFQWIGVAGRG
jgi:hypothetical protein